MGKKILKSTYRPVKRHSHLFFCCRFKGESQIRFTFRFSPFKRELGSKVHDVLNKTKAAVPLPFPTRNVFGENSGSESDKNGTMPPAVMQTRVTKGAMSGAVLDAMEFFKSGGKLQSTPYAHGIEEDDFKQAIEDLRDLCD